jgi:hypothetical protein
MTGKFSRELNDQLRQQLLSTLEVAFRLHFVKAMETFAVTLMSESMAETVDEFLTQFFNSEEMSCWLEFYDGKSRALVGVGPGDCAASFDLDLDNLDVGYADLGGPLNDAQYDDLVERVAAMRTFIAGLEENRKQLEMQIAGYEAKQVLQKC